MLITVARGQGGRVWCDLWVRCRTRGLNIFFVLAFVLTRELLSSQIPLFAFGLGVLESFENFTHPVSPLDTCLLAGRVIEIAPPRSPSLKPSFG